MEVGADFALPSAALSALALVVAETTMLAAALSVFLTTVAALGKVGNAGEVGAKWETLSADPTLVVVEGLGAVVLAAADKVRCVVATELGAAGWTVTATICLVLFGKEASASDAEACAGLASLAAGSVAVVAAAGSESVVLGF